MVYLTPSWNRRSHSCPAFLATKGFPPTSSRLARTTGPDSNAERARQRGGPAELVLQALGRSDPGRRAALRLLLAEADEEMIVSLVEIPEPILHPDGILISTELQIEGGPP